MITPEQIQQYHDEGYIILERVIPDSVIEGLREECAKYIADFDRQMEAKGLQTDGINHYKKRYFISNRSPNSPVMQNFLFSDLMEAVCRATLGDNIYLFNEQYVVKAAASDNKFSWHQDSGYIPYEHKPYLSCWCSLDDMSVENGTVYVLPYSRDGRSNKDDHILHEIQAGTNDKVGYYGDDPGEPAIVPVGSIVVFSSRTFHRSGKNSTPNMRRSYLAQYSKEPILNKEGTAPRAQAIPFIIDGKRAQTEVTS